MKKLLIIAVVFVALITSCRRGGEPESFLKFYYLNNSEREIKIVLFQIDNPNDTINLELDEKFLITEFHLRGDYSGSIGQVPPYYCDSINIYYNDTLYVQHLNYINNFQLNRNLYDNTAWEFIELGNSSFESIYEFTEADYQEALEL